MNVSPQKSSLGQLQRIILFLSALIFATLLFFYRTTIDSNEPLDQLARKSIDPEIALGNGHPTIFEFYADWCEACHAMAPKMLSIENQYGNDIDIVLLNVENTRWQDLLEKYEVNGIPQLNFFDSFGNESGVSIGVKTEGQLEELTHLLLNNEKIPSSFLVGKISNFNITTKKDNITKLDNKYIEPRSHS